MFCGMRVPGPRLNASGAPQRVEPTILYGFGFVEFKLGLEQLSLTDVCWALYSLSMHANRFL